MDIFFIQKENFLKNQKESIKSFLNYEFKSEKRRIEFALSRFLLDYAAKYYKIKNPETETKNRKPYFKNSKIQFSISHSKDIVAIAFNKSAVGLDVEFIKERDVEKIEKYFKRKFDTLEEFYEFWTEYEAEIKLQEDKCFGLTFKFLNDYMMSVAGIEEFSPINIFELEDNLCLKKLAQYS